MRVETGRDADATKWLEQRGFGFVPPYVTMVLAHEGEIRAVAVFNGYQQSNIDLSIVTDGPIPCNRRHLRALFTYPFKTAKVNRVSVRTSTENLKVRKLIRRLGFEPEGKNPKWYGEVAAISYGMLRQNCKWIK